VSKCEADSPPVTEENGTCGIFFQEALNEATNIRSPVSLIAWGLVILAVVLWIELHRRRKSRLAWLVAAGIIVLSPVPLFVSAYIGTRQVYHLRVMVLAPGGSPADNATVTCSIGGEPKQIQGGWEFDIPPQQRPADGKVNLYAMKKSAFLGGAATIVLGSDYYPTATIHLTSDTSAEVRGDVLDASGRAVAGAIVSVAGYPDGATTDANGNFSLPAHAAVGQIIEVRARKGRLAARVSAVAGQSVDIVLGK
jgi:hypothetical protein